MKRALNDRHFVRPSRSLREKESGECRPSSSAVFPLPPFAIDARFRAPTARRQSPIFRPWTADGFGHHRRSPLPHPHPIECRPCPLPATGALFRTSMIVRRDLWASETKWVFDICGSNLDSVLCKRIKVDRHGTRTSPRPPLARRLSFQNFPQSPASREYSDESTHSTSDPRSIPPVTAQAKSVVGIALRRRFARPGRRKRANFSSGGIGEFNSQIRVRSARKGAKPNRSRAKIWERRRQLRTFRLFSLRSRVVALPINPGRCSPICFANNRSSPIARISAQAAFCRDCQRS
jgi:hypothetical protein